MSNEILEKINTGFAEQPSLCLGYRNIVAKRKKRFALADDADFVLDHDCIWPCQDIDFGRFTPYAFNYDADSFLFVDTPREVLERPFFYLGQFEFARQALTVERSQLTKRLGGIDAAREKKPTFLFSIGRCGSTLFSQLAGAAGMCQISEPDIFTGTVRQSGDFRVGEVLGNAFLALEKFAAVEDHKILIKLRSQSCASASQFVSVFPDAHYLFLKRDLRTWATSFVSKFNWQASDLKRTLATGYRAYKTFLAADVNLNVIDYDALVNDPFSAAKRLSMKDTLPALLHHAVENVMSRDSQAGSGIRIRRDRQIVEQQVGAFLEDWTLNAPIEMRQFYRSGG